MRRPLAFLLLLVAACKPDSDDDATPSLVLPQFAAAASAGTVQSAAVLEASGLAASRKNAGVFWLHNDSGDSARLFAMTAAGIHLGEYALTGATATDWEDMAVGPGPGAAQHLFVGDIGDNAVARASITVWRVAEPDVSALQAPVTTTIPGAEAIIMTYPGGAHNAETLLVDPQNGDLYIVTKEASGASLVYRNPAPQAVGVSTPLALVGSVTFSTGSTLATGGDVSPGGEYIALRTYTHLQVWIRPPGTALADAFLAPPDPSFAHSEAQGETVTWDSVNGGLYTVSEGASQTIWFFSRTN